MNYILTSVITSKVTDSCCGIMIKQQQATVVQLFSPLASLDVC